MPFKEQSGYCATCNKQVLVRRETTNHVLYAILTIFSCGLWGIVWIIQSIAESGKAWLCTACGQPTFASRDQYQRLLHAQNSPSTFSPTNTSSTKSVGILLGIGIFFMPYIFSWFTLQKGYSSVVKIVSLSWMGLVLLIYVPVILLKDSRNVEPRNTAILSSSTNTAQVTSTPSETPKQTAVRPTSTIDQKVYKQGYRIGLERGRDREGLEVKNTAQVSILADTAADLVHQPKDKVSWTAGWRAGFIKSYNGRNPDAPITNMDGSLAR